MRFGLDLGRCHPRLWRDLARAGDAAGFESLWLPEHLVMPAQLHEDPAAGRDHPVIDPRTPVYDAFAMLAALAAVTERIRVGTNVYNIGLRHPFVTARGAATVDQISGGRFDLGIGASWLSAEWAAVGLDFAGRGSRVDEAIAVCRRLWTEPTIEHAGQHFSFAPVVFEPKPVQARLPVHVGGDSPRALRRAAALGDGWIGMIQNPATFAEATATLARRCEQHGRDPAALQRTALVARPTDDDIETWRAAGATRLIVAPWRRSADALDAVAEFAARHIEAR